MYKSGFVTGPIGDARPLLLAEMGEQLDYTDEDGEPYTFTHVSEDGSVMDGMISHKLSYMSTELLALTAKHVEDHPFRSRGKVGAKNNS